MYSPCSHSFTPYSDKTARHVDAWCADSKVVEGRQSDQLLLWAVEGLAGVVINGIPNNVPGTRALNTPKAVLWGQQDDSLVWPGMCVITRHTAQVF